MNDILSYIKLDPIYRKYHHDKLTFSLFYAFSENYILPFSHDENVHGKATVLNKMWGDYEGTFPQARTLYLYMMVHPGKKLNFMGGEFGQFIEWNWEKQLDWLLLGFPRHEQLHDYCRALNRLYTGNPAMYALDRSWDGFRWLNVDDSGRSSVAFLRSAPKNGSYVACVCNFTPVKYEGFVIGLPSAGTLTEILNSDDMQYGGAGDGNPEPIRSRRQPFMDMEHSAELTLPAMSALFFRFTPKKPKKKRAATEKKAD